MLRLGFQSEGLMMIQFFKLCLHISALRLQRAQMYEIIFYRGVTK